MCLGSTFQAEERTHQRPRVGNSKEMSVEEHTKQGSTEVGLYGALKTLHGGMGPLQSVGLGSTLIALGPHRDGKGAMGEPDYKAGRGNSRVARWVGIVRIQKVMKYDDDEKCSGYGYFRRTNKIFWWGCCKM